MLTRSRSRRETQHIQLSNHDLSEGNSRSRIDIVSDHELQDRPPQRRQGRNQEQSEIRQGQSNEERSHQDYIRQQNQSENSFANNRHEISRPPIEIAATERASEANDGEISNPFLRKDCVN
jgi:hypothetical protein